MSRIRWITFCLALAACGGEPTAPRSPAPAAVLLGRWDYARAAARRGSPSLNAGLHVTLAIDYVADADFGGRVERWFSGDVGVSPDVFGPVVGTMETREQLTLTIPLARPGAPTLRDVGTVAGRVLTVMASWRRR